MSAWSIHGDIKACIVVDVIEGFVTRRTASQWGVLERLQIVYNADMTPALNE